MIRRLFAVLFLVLLASPSLAQTKLLTFSPSGQTAPFTGMGSYNTLILACSGITTLSTGTNAYVNVQFSTDGGSSYDNTWANYTWGNVLSANSGSNDTDSASLEATAGSGVGVIVLHQPQATSTANAYGSLWMEFENVASATVPMSYFWRAFAYDLPKTDTYSFQGEGAYLGGGPVNGIQLVTGLLGGTATFQTGTCTWYGDD